MTLEAHVPEHNPARARLVRSDENRAHRRRRSNGSLNRMAQMSLDIFDPEQLDLDNYVYRWVQDTPGRMRMAMQADDYDYVSPDEIHGFTASQAGDDLKCESTGRLRQVVGEGKQGPVYAYLLKKPRWMWEDDQEAMVDSRDTQLRRRVVKGETGGDGDNDAAVEEGYVPGGMQVGAPAQRRRGRLPKSQK